MVIKVIDKKKESQNRNEFGANPYATYRVPSPKFSVMEVVFCTF